MVKRKGKWEREMDASGDKKQAKFDKGGWLKKPAPEPIVEFTTVNANELVVCPFCLYKAQLKVFFISNKKGISQKRAQCPDCNNTMQMNSLYNDMTIEQYAEWVFGYRRSGFWQKCPFNTWKDRLYKLGWSGRFWSKYQALKADATDESFEETMNRKAEEYAKELEASGEAPWQTE